MKRCSKCGLDRPLSEFVRDRRTPTGHACWCRTCTRRYNRDWKRRHRDRVLAQRQVSNERSRRARGVAGKPPHTRAKRKPWGNQHQQAEFSDTQRVGAAICPVCRSSLHDGTDGNGAAVIWCRCDGGSIRLAPVIRPPMFERYAATMSRQLWLEERVAQQCLAIPEEVNENSKNGKRHPWRQAGYVSQHQGAV